MECYTSDIRGGTAVRRTTDFLRGQGLKFCNIPLRPHPVNHIKSIQWVSYCVLKAKESIKKQSVIILHILSAILLLLSVILLIQYLFHAV